MSTPTTTLTTCPYCAVQCSFEIDHLPNQGPLAMRATPRCPVAHGSVCKKGLAALEEPTHPERLLSPLVRKAGRLEPVGWDEALDHTTKLIQDIQSDHGNNAFAVFGGGSLTNEKTYLLGKFARVALKTANIDYNGRFCMASAATAMRQVYGLDRGLPFPLERIGEASSIVLWGSNLAETLPPVSQFVAKARKRGASVIVIDPRETPSTKLGTLHAPVRPGADLPLALALLHVIAREGWQHVAFLQNRTQGWERLAKSLKEYSPTWAAAHTGLDPNAIEALAQVLTIESHRPGGLLVLSGRGPEQHVNGVNTVKALMYLALALGGLYAPLTGQGNGQGGREHGQKNDQLPGYRSIEDPQARQSIARLWGIAENELPGKGLSAQELFERCGGDIHGLLVLGSNPVVSAANTTQLTAKLQELRGLVVIDFFLSETAGLAEVVLPGSMWLEEHGTMTNLEGRVLRRRAVQAPPAQARSDWKIICQLAQKLSSPGFTFQNEEAIFDELARATQGAPADYSGISYDKLEATYQNGAGGIFWPCPSHDHPGTPQPFAQHFAHPDGLAKLEPLTHSHFGISDKGLCLTSGRLGEHYQSGTQTRRRKRLRSTHAKLELHPEVANANGLNTGDWVVLQNDHGCAEFEVQVSKNIRPDTLFAPFHFGGSNSVNRLIGPNLDPESRMPGFKLAHVRLHKTVTPKASTGTLEQDPPITT